MKLEKFKYVLMICIALALFLKVGNVISYLSDSRSNTEHALLSDEPTEKEERKVETEYFSENFLTLEYSFCFSEISKKVVVPNHLNKLNYFPEVLTPPPVI